jgi:hypothetical protein
MRKQSNPEPASHQPPQPTVEEPQPAPNAAAESIDDDLSEFATDEEVQPRADVLDNLDEYALAQDFNPNAVEPNPPVLCRRPPPDVYFRVRPGKEHTMTVGIYEASDDDGGRGDAFLVKPKIFPVFGVLVVPRQLFVCLTAQAKIYLWPAKLPRPGRRGGGMRYSETALKGAELGKSKWIRMWSDQEFKCYRVEHPIDEFPQPDWSDVPPLLELMRRAFDDGRVISGPDHPEVRRLIGARK